MNRNNYTAALGRTLIPAVFTVSGLSKLGAPAATQAYIASVGLPLPLPVLGYASTARGTRL